MKLFDKGIPLRVLTILKIILYLYVCLCILVYVHVFAHAGICECECVCVINIYSDDTIIIAFCMTASVVENGVSDSNPK